MTAVEWCPFESSMLATTSADNQLAVWDLALERDPGGYGGGGKHARRGVVPCGTACKAPCETVCHCVLGVGGQRCVSARVDGGDANCRGQTIRISSLHAPTICCLLKFRTANCIWAQTVPC